MGKKTYQSPTTKTTAVLSYIADKVDFEPKSTMRHGAVSAEWQRVPLSKETRPFRSRTHEQNSPDEAKDGWNYKGD